MIAAAPAENLATAITAARGLPGYAPPLPPGLAAPIAAALTAWNTNNHPQARDRLTAALTQARTQRYL